MKGIKDVANCVGQKYGRLTILEYIGSDSKYRSIVKVQCECGKIREVRLALLKYGSTTSCGCFNKEKVKKAATTHGRSKTPLYTVWIGMKDRCLNPNNTHYKHYGGRGIDIYSYWVDDFMSFFFWCLKNGWKKGLDIDRIDNNKGYSPNNCRIVSASINNRNKRSNINITIDGVTKVLQDWCLLYGLRHNTISCRIKRGWPMDKIFIPPTHSNRIIK